MPDVHPIRQPEEPVDLSAEVARICAALGLVPAYVARITLEPSTASVYVWKGRDGMFRGAKYVEEETGKPASETLTFRISTHRADDPELFEQRARPGITIDYPRPSWLERFGAWIREGLGR